MNNDSAEIISNRAKPWGFWTTGLLCACMAVISIGMFFTLFGYNSAVHVITSAAMENPTKFVLGYLIVSPVVIGCCVLFSRMRRGFTFSEYVGFQRPKTSQLLIWGGITVVIVTGMDLSDYGTGGVAAILKSANFMHLLFFTMMAVFLAPVTEEILFRGFAFKGLLYSMGPVWAVLLTAFIFSLVHMHRNIVAHAMIFVLAVLFGIARIRTKSLYVPIFMHATCNLIGMLQVWYWFAQKDV